MQHAAFRRRLPAQQGTWRGKDVVAQGQVGVAGQELPHKGGRILAADILAAVSAPAAQEGPREEVKRMNGMRKAIARNMQNSHMTSPTVTFNLGCDVTELAKLRARLKADDIKVSYTDILVKQFDAIEVLPAKGDQPAVFANGALSLGENIADQGGLRVAYTAYHNSLKGKETPAPIDGFTSDQRFYLAYAQLWAQNIRDEEIARLTKIDVHSLGKWRVNATLRNLQSFYDAFNITDGAMFMPDSRAMKRIQCFMTV